MPPLARACAGPGVPAWRSQTTPHARRDHFSGRPSGSHGAAAELTDPQMGSPRIQGPPRGGPPGSACGDEERHLVGQANFLDEEAGRVQKPVVIEDQPITSALFPDGVFVRIVKLE